MKQEQKDQLNEIGKGAYSVLTEMVAALNVNYQRLADLRDQIAGIEREASESGDDATCVSGDYDDLRSELKELEAAAGDCNEREEAETRIHEDALSVEVRSGWAAVGGKLEPEQFRILLTTGGPAVQIVGSLDAYNEPVSARLEVQDWFLPWTEYADSDEAVLLDYARCFYFGE